MTYEIMPSMFRLNAIWTFGSRLPRYPQDLWYSGFDNEVCSILSKKSGWI